MAAPVITYWNENATAEIGGIDPQTNQPRVGWAIGEIDAGTESEHFKFTIWNNKGGNGSDVSHAKNVKITTVNTTGSSAANDLISGKWVHVIVNGEGIGQAIGGYNDAQNDDNQANVWAVGIDNPAVNGYVIHGTGNDGIKANSPNNFAAVEAWVSVPANANEGAKPFLIRTSYSYT